MASDRQSLPGAYALNQKEISIKGRSDLGLNRAHKCPMPVSFAQRKNLRDHNIWLNK